MQEGTNGEAIKLLKDPKTEYVVIIKGGKGANEKDSRHNSKRKDKSIAEAWMDDMQRA